MGKKYIPEITVPEGYSLEELLDTDDSELAAEKPISVEEVKLNFE